MTRHTKEITNFLNKAFLPFASNSKNTNRVYACKLVEARSFYVENVCNKADRLHDRIKESYEESFAESYVCTISNLIKALKQGVFDVAIDITSIDFFGEIKGFDIHPFHKDGKSGEFRFAVISAVNKIETEKFPVYALPFRLGENLAKVIEQLLDIASKLLSRIKLVLLDRGFYSAEVIELLNKRVRYLMLVPQFSLFRCMLEQLKGEKRVIEYIDYEMKYKKDFSTFRISTKLILINNQADFDWVFATNIANDKALYYIISYKRRWQIETNFRVAKEAEIRSRSTYLQIRYFYFLVRMLLHAIWVVRIRKNRTPFAVFLHDLDRMLLFDLLGIKYVYADA